MRVMIDSHHDQSRRVVPSVPTCIKSSCVIWFIHFFFLIIRNNPESFPAHSALVPTVPPPANDQTHPQRSRGSYSGRNEVNWANIGGAAMPALENFCLTANFGPIYYVPPRLTAPGSPRIILRANYLALRKLAFSRSIHHRNWRQTHLLFFVSLLNKKLCQTLRKNSVLEGMPKEYSFRAT